MSKYCHSCGNRAEESAKFCGGCGVERQALKDIPPIERGQICCGADATVTVKL